MAERVVDGLEIIDIDQNQSVGSIEKLDLLNRLLHFQIDIAPIRHSRQSVRIRERLQFAGSFLQLLQRIPCCAVVAEDFYRTRNPSLFLPDRRDAHRDGNAMALLRSEEHTSELQSLRHL